MKTTILNRDYQCSITSPVSTEEAFEKIATVNEWWTAHFKGRARDLNDTFSVTFGETFVNFRISESIPGQLVSWHVTDCNLHWLADKKEWKDTIIRWEISPDKEGATINMTHIGLTQAVACYENCEKGWDHFIKQSLARFLTEGTGMPEGTERDIRVR